MVEERARARRAGILMAVSSLPSPYGIGTLGAAARDFADFLAAAGQSVWQILPLGHTGFGNSPYQAFSAWAGNPYFIDLDALAADGLLERDEYAALDWGADAARVDYGRLWELRLPILRLACSRLLRRGEPDYAAFCAENAAWLDDYALFMALKYENDGAPWQEWPEDIRLRRAPALDAARARLAESAEIWRAVQYLFFRQWRALKGYAASVGVSIMGDMPIYVAPDSADVWAGRELFRLDAEGRPTEVAGCPPDAFSADGQLWGSPLFDWERMERDGFDWWLRRLGFSLNMFDAVRIDHFRGFESFYAIPAGDATARFGRWLQGPGLRLFRRVREVLGDRDIVAEDLGILTDAVRRLRRECGYPGMKVLQFAFDDPENDNPYLPHNCTADSVAYVGTHDNPTIRGWLDAMSEPTRRYAADYMRLDPVEGEIWGVLRTLWSCPSALAVATAQDILELGAETRMNLPSTVSETNWSWRALPDAFTPKLSARLRHEMEVYHRLGENVK
ncbi:MAG: 4-alpha-glucanotransferase [Oscillospiraceae bacterium]|nr:4-alpha-glucanotransferase [Oscillospiraceae bacterium]MCD8373997.1 4-alpha-glucanotransferase [Oscillospiraceae bacterium]